MIQIGFCDDDPSVLDELHELLGSYRTEHNADIAPTAFQSPFELLAAIEKGARFDILLLDVLMPGENGIEAAREIRQYDSNVKIIFLTSSAEFAVQSYTVGAYFYQLKPIWPESFFRLMDSVIAACSRESSASLILRCKTGITRVELDKLEYCEVIRRSLLLKAAPAIRSVSQYSRAVQCQFGIVPAVYYAFDYATRVYTDLLFSGSAVVVEFMPFVCSAAYLLFLIHISKEQHARLRLEELKSNLDLQVHQAVREIEALRISQQKTRAYRHDLRHHLQYITACIENEQYEQALQYIHSISEEIEASRVTVYCENEAANLILSSFADRAKAQSIPLAVHAVLPNQLPLAESDLCVLLSNALENAIHACSERADGIPGHIEVQTYEKAGKFFLQIVNDCTQPVQFSHGVPVSDRAGHGIGVHSICSIVERYGGVYSFSVRNQQFILRISL